MSLVNSYARNRLRDSMDAFPANQMQKAAYHYASSGQSLTAPAQILGAGFLFKTMCAASGLELGAVLARIERMTASVEQDEVNSLETRALREYVKGELL